MPQLRSFTGFMPGPNLSQAYTAGVGLAQRDEELAAKIMLEREQMANQAGIASANRGLEREGMAQRFGLAQQQLGSDQQKIAQAMQMAQMEDATKRSALEQEVLSKSQALETDKFYKQGVLSMKAKELEQQNVRIQAAAKAAEDELLARKQYQDYIQTNYGDTGEVDRDKAVKDALALYGGRMNLTAGSARALGGGGADAINGQPGTTARQIMTEDGSPLPGYFAVPTSDGRQQIIAPTASGGAATSYGVQGDPTKVQIVTGRTSTIRTAPEQAKIARLSTEIEKDKDQLIKNHPMAPRLLDADQDKLSPTAKAEVKKYREDELEIRKKIKQLRDLEQKGMERSASAVTNNPTTARSPATLPPGMGGGSTNQTRRLRYNPQTGDFE